MYYNNQMLFVNDILYNFRNLRIILLFIIATANQINNDIFYIKIYKFLPDSIL